MFLCLALSVLAMPVYPWLHRTDRVLARSRLPNGHVSGDMRGMMSSRGLWRLLAVSGAVLVTVDLIYAFVPMWAIEQNISAAAVGALLALRALVSVVSLTKPSLHGAALGLRMTVNQLAQISLPLGVGAVAAPLGVVGIFWANAALLAGAIAIVVASENGPEPQAGETGPYGPPPVRVVATRGTQPGRRRSTPLFGRRAAMQGRSAR